MNVPFDDVWLQLHPEDQVAVLKRTLKKGVRVERGDKIWETQSTIPAGHKVALCSLSKGDPLLKYGQIIGFATQEIHPGDHVHVHNLGMGDFGRDYLIGEAFRPLQRTT